MALGDTIVHYDTSLGGFDVRLFDSAAPVTVTNFLRYVNAGIYNHSIIHRSVPNFVIQGGGHDTQGLPLPTFAPIPLEYGIPNTRGTIGMGRFQQPDTATDQFFFNLVDNSTILGPSNSGGYAVFGQVLGNGMNIIDVIAGLPTFNYGGDLFAVPLRNLTPGSPVTTDNLVVVNSITVTGVVPEPSTATLVALALVVGAAFYFRRIRSQAA